MFCVRTVTFKCPRILRSPKITFVEFAKFVHLSYFKYISKTCPKIFVLGKLDVNCSFFLD